MTNIATVNSTAGIMVTSQSFTFDGGLSAVENCDLPAINSISSPTYSTSSNMYDAQGNIKATHISGLDQRVITATIGHINSLYSDTIQTDDLIAKSLSAIDLMADTPT
mgnify:CR=1 FL=1